MNKVPLLGISRLRMGTDGQGVTTLVAFYGCPLNCAYCLNSDCHKPEGVRKIMSAKEIFDEVRKDALYFKATNGGITFGGGEPMLRPDIIKEIRQQCEGKWRITVETSLNVDHHLNDELIGVVDHYIVDVKDMNPTIYKEYTGQRIDGMLFNLKTLQRKGCARRVTIRLPLIEGYNTDADRDKSEKQLKQMGFEDICRFSYIKDVAAYK